MYVYNQFQWLLIFYVYCFCGWVWESAVVSAQQRHFVSRGFLRGPWLPIYGFGATMILHVSLPLMGQPLAIYFAGMASATAFEYVVGVVMEALFKVKYWDYSTHKFQFQGRICLDSSIAWGFLALLLTYVLHKPVADFITGLPFYATAAVSLLLSGFFLYDTVTSAKAAFEFASVLEDLEKLRTEADELRVQLRLGAYEAQDRIEDLRGQLKTVQADLRERSETAQAELRERVEAAQAELREQLKERLAGLEDDITERMNRKNKHYRALMRANPSLRAPRFQETLRIWREKH